MVAVECEFKHSVAVECVMGLGYTMKHNLHIQGSQCQLNSNYHIPCAECYSNHYCLWLYCLSGGE